MLEVLLPEEPSLLQPLLEVLLPEEPLLPQLLLDTLLAQLLPLLVLDSQPHLTLLVSFTQLLRPTSTMLQVMLAAMPPQLQRLTFTMHLAMLAVICHLLLSPISMIFLARSTPLLSLL